MSESFQRFWQFTEFKMAPGGHLKFQPTTEVFRKCSIKISDATPFPDKFRRFPTLCHQISHEFVFFRLHATNHNEHAN